MAHTSAVTPTMDERKLEGCVGGGPYVGVLRQRHGRGDARGIDGRVGSQKFVHPTPTAA
uniref:Casein kinase I n=1 Tax=Mesocestoides corti TaxID=53468 RepID=A0A5K3FVS3_MESCO